MCLPVKMKNAQVLNENRDFLRLYRRGKSAVSPVLVTYARRGGVKGRRRIGDRKSTRLNSSHR